MPIFFIVPVVTAKGQRFGDMVAGTLVIADEQPTIGDLRDQLTAMPAAERKFQFDATALKRARPQDMLAVEKLLERWSKLADAERQALLQRIVPPLAARLEVECPLLEDWPVFLRDLLAAEFRRQHRQLG